MDDAAPNAHDLNEKAALLRQRAHLADDEMIKDLLSAAACRFEHDARILAAGPLVPISAARRDAA